ncbi:MAG: NAD-dependent epimerase/dehydratase family protein [Synergistaceae bacterium]|nr:NAD-dependent epimerase/dehydratase family protein [Synergistaceae bacterium]
MKETKKILITGAGSYVGTSFEKWLSQWPDSYHIDTIDMIDGSWREKSFVGYDVVFHVAGIAHSDTSKANELTKRLYYQVNTELAVETAIKAKNDGVKLFIQMSSIIVYGNSAPIGKEKIITKETPVNPDNFYGDSKLQAETGILKLLDEQYSVAILRPPMIYGKGSKGNYPKLAKLAKTLPIFPDIENFRSMIFIDNLSEFIRIIIDNNCHGIFFPQNEDYVQTRELVKEIAGIHGKNIYLTSFFNLLIKHVFKKSKLFNKVFGNLCYDKKISNMDWPYNIYNFSDSIRKTEAWCADNV